MASFHLKVLTVERCFYDDDVDRIVVRTSTGDIGILPNHVPYTAALGVGGLMIIKNGQKRFAAVSGGFLNVSKEQTVILARTCEWSEEIDVNRAKEAESRARSRLQQKDSAKEYNAARVKLHKAVNRIRIAENK